MSLWRAIRREQPIRTFRRRMLVAFPFEIGYARFLWFTRGHRGFRAFASPHAGTREVEYSANYLTKYAPDRRVEWTMFLLASIPDCERDSLLVIGPRYEPELLMAVGLGWNKNGVRGLDTFSYSPLVDVGDMHQLPYADSSFSSLICAWTLSYSTQPGRAAAEMQRVLRPGGYLVVSMQKVADGYDDILPGVPHGDDRIQTLVQLDTLFMQLDRVAGFEPEPTDAGHGHTIAAYRRPIPT
jgi:hypothetical protein